jgi:hypothetical protein
MCPMFGLMKSGPRAPYCGACKTLGALYGHKTRLLLNHDIAFLAEVLLDLQGVSLTAPAYRSFNCLKLPAASDEIPTALQYAAATTVVLAHFRASDHRRDSSQRGRRFAWSVAARALARPYRAAAEHLRSRGFPIDSLAAMLESQVERESDPRSLTHLAEPTMIATAMVFSHGVRLAGHADRAGDAWRLGYRFGELIYLLDALEDRARDAAAGAFNPLFVLPHETAASVRERILSCVAELEPEMKPSHAARLRGNVEERLGLRPRVLQAACRRSVRERIRDAVAFARSLRGRENAGYLKGAAILASVTFLAFIFPEHARRTDSWQQCLGVSMNLMALGAVFATPPQLPRQYPMAQPDTPTATVGGCKDCCTDCCLEGVVDAICDSIG